MTRSVLVIDPCRFTHVVELTENDVHGYHNLAHLYPVDPPEVRTQVITELLERFRQQERGTHRGYEWCTL